MNATNGLACHIAPREATDRLATVVQPRSYEMIGLSVDVEDMIIVTGDSMRSRLSGHVCLASVFNGLVQRNGFHNNGIPYKTQIICHPSRFCSSRPALQQVTTSSMIIVTQIDTMRPKELSLCPGRLLIKGDTPDMAQVASNRLFSADG